MTWMKCCHELNKFWINFKWLYIIIYNLIQGFLLPELPKGGVKACNDSSHSIFFRLSETQFSIVKQPSWISWCNGARNLGREFCGARNLARGQISCAPWNSLLNIASHSTIDTEKIEGLFTVYCQTQHQLPLAKKCLPAALWPNQLPSTIISLQ